MPRNATTRLPRSTVARHVAVEAVKPRRHSLFTCTRRVRRRGLELKPRVLSELGTSAAGATESSARWPTTLVACTLAVDERTRAAPVKPVKSRLLTRYNAAAVVLQATHAEEAYGPRLQFLSRVVGCSADVRLRAKERPRCAGSLSLRPRWCFDSRLCVTAPPPPGRGAPKKKYGKKKKKSGCLSLPRPCTAHK